MKKRVSFKILKYLFLVVAGFFALIGFGLSAAYLAVKFHITDDPGVVDLNDRYFQEIKDKYGKQTDRMPSDVLYDEARLLNNLFLISKYYPENATYILNAYSQSHNLNEAWRMVEAVNLYLQDNQEYHASVDEFSATEAEVKKLCYRID